MNLLTVIHVAAGTAALGAGAAALILRKGGLRHATIGKWFVISMFVLGATAAVLAPFKPVPDRISMLGGIFVCYLVTTSWVIARRRNGRAGTLEVGGLAVAASCAAAFLTLGFMAVNSPTGRLDGYAPPVMFANAVLATLAAVLDLNFILRRSLSGVQRLARHLWRMCVALVMAAAAFFLGQQKVMPEAIQGSQLLLVPTLVALVMMVFWLLRLRFVKAFRRGARTAETLFERIVHSDREDPAHD